MIWKRSNKSSSNKSNNNFIRRIRLNDLEMTTILNNLLMIKMLLLLAIQFEIASSTPSALLPLAPTPFLLSGNFKSSRINNNNNNKMMMMINNHKDSSSSNSRKSSKLSPLFRIVRIVRLLYIFMFKFSISPSPNYLFNLFIYYYHSKQKLYVLCVFERILYLLLLRLNIITKNLK